MLKNILFIIGGVFTGFVIGFLITNNSQAARRAHLANNYQQLQARLTGSSPLDPSSATASCRRTIRQSADKQPRSGEQYKSAAPIRPMPERDGDALTARARISMRR
jgi:hypothetical protein